jgi:hypothetical protein
MTDTLSGSNVDSPYLSTGLRTSARPEDLPSCLRVDWILWDSGFRPSELRPGDEIVAVDGTPLTELAQKHGKASLPGQDQEHTAWQAAGVSDSHPLNITVRRRQPPRAPGPGVGHVQFVVTGRLRAERVHQSPDGRRLLGEGGPPRLSNDGFSGSWAAWYERLVYVWERQLTGSIWSSGADNRLALAQHLNEEARVRFAAEHYPGEFAAALLADWTLVHQLLEGRQYHIGHEELAHREDEALIRRAVSHDAEAAWEAFIASRKADILPLQPGAPYIGERLDAVAGKLLVMPPLSPSSWVLDTGRPVAVWNEAGTVVVTDMDAPALQPVWKAQLRYRRSVSAGLSDGLAMVGRIRPQSRLIAPEGVRATVALDVEPVAVLMGNDDTRMFLDLTLPGETEPPFAGESRLKVQAPAPLPDDASPVQVMETLVAALRARDIDTWYSLFCPWQVLQEAGRAYLYPYWPYPPQNRDSDWIRSRRVLMEKICAIRIAWVSEPQVMPNDPMSQSPTVWRVELELDHIGEFDGEFRSFNGPDVHRHWVLSRLDQGPWRILTHQGI